MKLDRDVATYNALVAEAAWWERRWEDAVAAVQEGLAHAGSEAMAQIRVWLCSEGLRAEAELAALARLRHQPAALNASLARASALREEARHAAATAVSVTPNAAGWLALAEAEHDRAAGTGGPTRWRAAAERWDDLERPPFAAYCRWREAEALAAFGAPRADVRAPLRQAHVVAARLGAAPLRHELERLAARARIDLRVQPAPEPPPDLGRQLGLTPREAEVLALVAEGLTNREIAAELVISVKTAGVHVSHILQKLDAPNRQQAAAIAHKLSPPV
jgi:DNA-binding CsgD family transcriptional regulator